MLRQAQNSQKMLAMASYFHILYGLKLLCSHKYKQILPFRRSILETKHHSALTGFNSQEASAVRLSHWGMWRIGRRSCNGLPCTVDPQKHAASARLSTLEIYKLHFLWLVSQFSPFHALCHHWTQVYVDFLFSVNNNPALALLHKHSQICLPT